MYVLKRNDHVVLGPIHWDKQRFQSYLYTNYSMEFPLPYTAPSNKVIEIDANTSIWEVVFLPEPTHNKRSQKLDGPFYEYGDTKTNQYFTVLDRTLDEAKAHTKYEYSQLREDWEKRGTKVTLSNGKNYFVPTDKMNGERFVFCNGLAGKWNIQEILNEKEPYEYEMVEVWVDLSDDDLNTICSAVKDWVKLCYDIEYNAHTKIDAATTMDEIVAFTYEDFVTL